MPDASLTLVQVAFLCSLRAAARVASECQDGIKVSEMMRLNLVYWSETRDPCPVSTFSLTPLGAQLVGEGGAGVPVLAF